MCAGAPGHGTHVQMGGGGGGGIYMIVLQNQLKAPFTDFL